MTIRWLAWIGLLVPVASPAWAMETEFDRWLPVRASEFGASGTETGAQAVVLYDGTIFDERHADRTTRIARYRRLLILDPGGVERFGDVTLDVGPRTRVSGLRARSFKRDGTMHGLGTSDFRKRTLVAAAGVEVERWSFAFQGLAPGDILEYRYRLETPRWEPPPTPLQGSMPARRVEVTWWPRSRIGPFRMDPTFVLSGADALEPGIEYHPDRSEPEAIRFRFENVPAVAIEPYMPPIEAVSATLIAYYRLPGHSSSYWEEAAASIGAETREYCGRNQLVRKALKAWPPAENPLVEATRAARWIREHIRIREIDPVTGEFPENEHANDLLRGRVGTHYDANRLLVAMLRERGIPATVGWYRGRSQGVFLPSWETVGQFTGTLVAVHAGGTIHWYAPALALYDAVPWDAAHCDVILEDSIGAGNPFPLRVRIPGTPPGRNRVFVSADLEMNANLQVEGSLRIVRDCPSEAVWRRHLEELSSAQALDAVRDGLLQPGLDWASKAERLEISGDSLVYEADVRISGLVQSSDSLYVIDLGRVRPDAIDLGSGPRVHDIHFEYPVRYFTSVSILAPEGYAFGTPPTQPLDLREEFAAYQLFLGSDGRNLRMGRGLEITHDLLRGEAVAEVRAFFERCYRIEPVVLARAGVHD